jgi:hypothetical protein
VAKLEADLKTALQDPSVLPTLDKIGATPVSSSSKEFDAYMHAEATKWEPVLKAANIRAHRMIGLGLTRLARTALLAVIAAGLACATARRKSSHPPGRFAWASNGAVRPRW